MFVIKYVNIRPITILMAAKAQRTGHLLRENELWKVLKSHKFMFGALIPTVSNSEGQVIRLL
jgi:hypothetical protein